MGQTIRAFKSDMRLPSKCLIVMSPAIELWKTPYELPLIQPASTKSTRNSFKTVIVQSSDTGLWKSEENRLRTRS